MSAPTPDPLVRPSLDEAVTALALSDSRFSWVGPTPEEGDAAEALRHIAATHQGSVDCDDPDKPRNIDRIWGTCATCREPWPCAVFSNAQALAVEFLGRAVDRYADHANTTSTRAERTSACSTSR